MHRSAVNLLHSLWSSPATGAAAPHASRLASSFKSWVGTLPKAVAPAHPGNTCHSTWTINPQTFFNASAAKQSVYHAPSSTLPPAAFRHPPSSHTFQSVTCHHILIPTWTPHHISQQLNTSTHSCMSQLRHHHNTVVRSVFHAQPATHGRHLASNVRVHTAHVGSRSTLAWLSVRHCATKTQTKQWSSPAELGMYGAAAAVAMIGFSYAAVPMYKVFCAATGYSGTVAGKETVEEKLRKRREQPNVEIEKAAAQREVTVWFNADVADDMPWTFTPAQESVTVKPGQSTLAFFTAHNKSDTPVTGYSVYNVTPDKTAKYFNKIQCFCFEEQRLRARETVDMPVFFYLDPELASDWHCRNINDITLSYVFHKVDDADLEDYEDDVDAAPGSGVKLHGSGTLQAMPAGSAQAYLQAQGQGQAQATQAKPAAAAA